ncbi:hypothetical protein E4T46_05820 [Aureobasidium subglaciale]|nr:hypothetical protein E4T41_05926 [Aureobasidium subglaciale]KAI5260607.1 hypothetical protein E4T46_05820 [Aureobasidium subglaciale]
MTKPTVDLRLTCFNLGTWQAAIRCQHFLCFVTQLIERCVDFILLFIMTSNFHPPTRPIVLNSGHIAIHNRTLGLRCHDRRFRDAVVCDEQTDKLFEFTAKDIGTSWTLRRSLVNSTTGQRLLDLRHTKTSYKVCVIEDPDGNEFCKIKDTTSTFSSKFTSVDAQVVGNGGEPTIEMRVDVALIIALAFVRAEISHPWRR